MPVAIKTWAPSAMILVAFLVLFMSFIAYRGGHVDIGTIDAIAKGAAALIGLGTILTFALYAPRGKPVAVAIAIVAAGFLLLAAVGLTFTLVFRA